MSTERLKLVESFDELRTGMLVVRKPCGWCGDAHRGILLSAHGPTLPIARAGGTSPPARHFFFAPVPACAPDKRITLVLSEYSIAQRVIYRVLDGLESTTREAEHAIPASRASWPVSR